MRTPLARLPFFVRRPTREAQPVAWLFGVEALTLGGGKRGNTQVRLGNGAVVTRGNFRRLTTYVRLGVVIVKRGVATTGLEP